MTQYQIWAYGTTYTAQSKTKVVAKFTKVWAYTPAGFSIDKVVNNRVVDSFVLTPFNSL